MQKFWYLVLLLFLGSCTRKDGDSGTGPISFYDSGNYFAKDSFRVSALERNFDLIGERDFLVPGRSLFHIVFYQEYFFQRYSLILSLKAIPDRFSKDSMIVLCSYSVMKGLLASPYNLEYANYKKYALKKKVWRSSSDVALTVKARMDTIVKQKPWEHPAGALHNENWHELLYYNGKDYFVILTDDIGQEKREQMASFFLDSVVGTMRDKEWEKEACWIYDYSADSSSNTNCIDIESWDRNKRSTPRSQ